VGWRRLLVYHVWLEMTVVPGFVVGLLTLLLSSIPSMITMLVITQLRCLLFFFSIFIVLFCCVESSPLGSVQYRNQRACPHCPSFATFPSRQLRLSISLFDSAYRIGSGDIFSRSLSRDGSTWERNFKSLSLSLCSFSVLPCAIVSIFTR